ncbi:IS3 family transposase, partial [Enterococcus faecium]|uniref:IS3 family transposase n=1 Tax=Enterococcus faecium TaxID=1352 RepID=UPI00338E58D6
MSDVFEFIQSNVHDHDVKQMCTVLEAPKSSYYDWKKKKPSKRQSENKRLNRLISGIYFENKGIYGAPKIHKILVGRGEILSLKKVQILMRKLESSPDSCVKCYTMFLPFLLIKIDVF